MTLKCFFCGGVLEDAGGYESGLWEKPALRCRECEVLMVILNATPKSFRSWHSTFERLRERWKNLGYRAPFDD
jgi:hypothetical protein